MFNNTFNQFGGALSWYTDHAALIFTVMIAAMIVTELVTRVARQKFGRRERVSTLTSLTSGGAFLIAKTIFGRLAATGAALAVYDHFRLTTLDLANPLVWVLAFTMRDFVYYWVHRAEHQVRVLWASHMVHHSPETIGFTTAVRVPWMEALYKPWFGLWLPLIGFHPVAAIAMDVLAATYAQLYHTERVRRVPVLERVLVTPSHHRVHHGSNPEYIDKNFGATFVVWDHLFGTYEPEVAPVRYGIGKHKIDTPVAALTGGYPDLVNDMLRQPTWAARAGVAFAPPS